ncbi:MAG: DNA polymerase/3'-5' exonuclease PolX [Nanoarchaeota archaeon]|nr:DNA polymerase/3'-5' exonuclease PolX [Nanoarchaeota archaeon]MBU1632786.1 DNA polymerase/3'-5' exonuclease PolX [Nanoarchaeota archaeon]MBU1876711.1 DNA polymerase/3'-5' exonuclease PolX [Nanoarchaeota archaeon]
MKNLEITKILNNIADILELQDIQFKPQAYRKAAMAIESLTEDIEDIYKRGELEEIPGVGKHIAEKIEEFIKTGKLKYYQKLKKEVKVDIEELNEIPFLGPKKIKYLYQKLKIKNIKDLERAIIQKKLRELTGFGEKTEQIILEGIAFLKSRPKRFLYIHALPIVEEIKKYFSKYDFVKKIEIAGSFRRAKETIGDLDFLVISTEPGKVMEVFTKMPDVKEVLARGETKSSVRLSNGMQVDLRVVKEKEFGSALLYFIGNKQHNVELRKIALKKGYTLSEYGLFNLEGKKWAAGRTEEEIYKKLGMRYIEPELRENTGELKASLQNSLPKLITTKEVNGVFHNHTKWSDGNNNILEMAQKAEEMKLKFISFNDHFGTMGITNPLDEKRLKKYLDEIEKVQKKVGIKVFSGVEIDIMKNGSLPLTRKKLKELDVVIAAVHTSIKMDAKTMTERVCKALQNNPINILAHPTDRLINERNPLNINLEKVFDTAKQNDVYLEINGSPKRMDLSGEHIKSALERRCRFALSTDAHDLTHLPFYSLSINLARRGWAEKKDILNCWSLPKIEKALIKS